MPPAATPATETIDAHHHLWRLGGSLCYGWLDQPELASIRRDFGSEALRPHREAAGIDRTVVVQTLADRDETRWLLEQARRDPTIAGVVGWVDLLAENIAEQLAEFRDDPCFVGVRHVVHDEPDPNWIIRPEAIRGLRVLEAHGVPFDLLFRPEHLHHASTLAARLPDLPLVLDHLAKPPIRSRRWDRAWEENLRSASRYPNVCCKVSGLITEADHGAWTVDQLRPWADLALSLFGPDRLLFGSDWPVCELAGSYEAVHQAARDLVSRLSPAEQASLWGGAAARCYRLPAPRSARSIPEVSSSGDRREDHVD